MLHFYIYSTNLKWFHNSKGESFPLREKFLMHVINLLAFLPIHEHTSSIQSTVLTDRAAQKVCIIILRTAAGVYSYGLQRYNRAQQLMSQSWTMSLSVKIAIWRMVLSP